MTFLGVSPIGPTHEAAIFDGVWDYALSLKPVQETLGDQLPILLAHALAIAEPYKSARTRTVLFGVFDIDEEFGSVVPVGEIIQSTLHEVHGAGSE